MFIAVRNSLNRDLTEDVLPWFAHLTGGGLQAISGAYSDYPPTYLYLLATLAPVHPVISDVSLSSQSPWRLRSWQPSSFI